MADHKFSGADQHAWELFDRTRGMDVTVVLLSVAFLSLLRWLDGQRRGGESKASIGVSLWHQSGENDPKTSPLFSWDALRSMPPDEFRALLQQTNAYEQPSSSNPLQSLYHTLRKIVRDAPAMGDVVIESAMRWIDAQPAPTTTEGRQAFADAFERLLVQTTSVQSRTAGFQTPPAVADLIVDLAAPQSGERIYDPCFGIGGLLARAGKGLGSASSHQGMVQDERAAIFGGEINPTAYSIGAVRILLGGAIPQLRLGDSLERDVFHLPAEEQFDCVVAVPPFGQRLKHNKYPQYPIASTDATDLFLQHAVRALRPGGRAVIAVPDGFRYRRGATKNVRKWLMQEHRLDAVLPLPKGAFTPYTGIRTSILVIRRLEPKNVVWFFDKEDVAQAVGVSTSKRSNAYPPLEDDYGYEQRAVVAEPVHALQQGHGIDRIKKLTNASPEPVLISKLEEREYELLKKREGAEELQSFLKEARKRISGVQIQALNHIAEIRSGVTYSRSNTTEDSSAEGPFMIRMGDIKAGTLRKPALRYDTPLTSKQERCLVQSGDVLLSRSGTIGKVAVVPPEFAGAVASQGLVILRVKEEESVRPAYLAKLLRSALYQDWLAGHARGSTIGHLRLQSLKKLPIPVLPSDHQERVETAVAEGADASEVMKALAEARTPDPLRSWLLSSSGPELTSSLSSALLQDRAPDLEKSSSRKQIGGAGAGVMGAAAVGAAALGGPIPILGALLAASSGAFIGTRAFRALHHLRRQSNDKALKGWVGHYAEVGLQLQEAMEIEPGPERYAMLEGLGLPARALVNSVPEGEPAIRERAQVLSNALVKLIEKERESLLDNVHITAHLESAVIDLGETSSLSLSLRNDGLLRLRQLKISVPSLEASKEAAQFPAGNAVAVELQAPSSRVGEHAIMIRWKATRLDGANVSGEIEVAYRVRDSSQVVTRDFKEFGSKPYIAGKRLRPEMDKKHRKLFKGRRTQSEQVADALRGQGGAATIVIEGARRIGKSSLAGEVVAISHKLQGWIPVYLDLQGERGTQKRTGAEDQIAEGLETATVFFSIAREVAFAAAEEKCAFDVPGYGRVSNGSLSLGQRIELQQELRKKFDQDDDPFSILDLFLGEVLGAVAPKTVLLILDEFDKIQQGIQNGVTSPQVIENLRALFQKHDIAVIIVGSPRLRRLRESYSNALYGFAEPIVLGPLDEEAARQLVTEPVKDTVVYAPAAVDYILELTACQPYIIQSLCGDIFKTCKQTNTRTVTRSFVETCANEVAPRLPHFKHVFEADAESDRKRYLIAVTEANAESSTLTFASFEQFLEDDGIGTKGLTDDLDDLVHEEILSREERGKETVYRLSVPLLAFWLRNSENYDHAILRSRAAEEHPA